MTKPHKTVQSDRQETKVASDEQAAGNSDSEGLVSVSLSMHKCRIVYIAGLIIESDSLLIRCSVSVIHSDPPFCISDPLCLKIHLSAMFCC